MVSSIPEEIIIPPAKIIENIEKFIPYVIKNGKNFETRMKSKVHEFPFLSNSDPYNGYYLWKLEQIRLGKDVAKETNPTTIVAMDKPLPKKFQFMVDLPPISSLDLDIIKLAALFVAKNGENYRNHILTQKNHSGQFDFLKKEHSLNRLYSDYVKQYVFLLDLGSDSPLIKELAETAESTSLLLGKAFHRAEFLSQKESEQKQETDRIEKEKLEFASIDWQDFVIVETITFDDVDMYTELPPAVSIAELQYRSLEQKKANSLLEDKPHNPEKEIYVAKSQVKQPVEVPLPASTPGTFIPRPKGIKIKDSSETRSRNQRRNNTQTEKMIKDPLTQKLIPESKLSEHLRILLRDPRYNSERENFERKNNTYTNVSTDEIFENLTRLARKGGSNTDDDSSSKKVYWDGYSGSVDHVKRVNDEAVDEAEVEAKRRKRLEDEKRIGPH